MCRVERKIYYGYISSDKPYRGGVEPHLYDYSTDNKLRTLITYMQDNGYQWAMVNRLTTEFSAQRIYHISELEKMLTFTQWNTGMAGFSYWQGGSTSYALFYYTETKTMVSGFTIYLF